MVLNVFMVVLVSVFLFASCEGKEKNESDSGVKYDNKKDFRVIVVDSGKEKGIRITGYLGSKSNVNIPPVINNLPVIEIGEKAFYYKKITGIIIPDSVKKIGNEAFAGNNLTSITLGNGVFFDNIFGYDMGTKVSERKTAFEKTYEFLGFATAKGTYTKTNDGSDIWVNEDISKNINRMKMNDLAGVWIGGKLDGVKMIFNDMYFELYLKSGEDYVNYCRGTFTTDFKRSNNDGAVNLKITERWEKGSWIKANLMLTWTVTERTYYGFKMTDGFPQNIPDWNGMYRRQDD
jgi:hypothetical protein